LEAALAKAIWNGKVVAESDSFEEVEGNVYFPPSALKREYFTDSDHTSICPWKGTAGYFNLTVDGKDNPNAAWIYRDPKPAAANIKDHIAFWRGVEVVR
jgi:uncharacterized protein (DUF427 family)